MKTFPDFNSFTQSGYDFADSTQKLYSNFLRFSVGLPVETSVIEDIEKVKTCWTNTTENEKEILRQWNWHSSGITYLPPRSITFYKYQPDLQENKGYLKLDLETRVQALKNAWGLYYIVYRIIKES